MLTMHIQGGSVCQLGVARNDTAEFLQPLLQSSVSHNPFNLFKIIPICWFGHNYKRLCFLIFSHSSHNGDHFFQDSLRNTNFSIYLKKKWLMNFSIVTNKLFFVTILKFITVTFKKCILDCWMLNESFNFFL